MQSELKKSLAREIENTAREWTQNPVKMNGGDWWQLQAEEAHVFRIDQADWAKMMLTYHCYEVFTGQSHAELWPGAEEELKAARAEHLKYTDRNFLNFANFAKEYTGMTYRQSEAVFAKMHWWEVRGGITYYADAS